jgi:hypothetical protein
MGAIYALEQIAKDSHDLHWPVMQILTAYLREHSPDLPRSWMGLEKKGVESREKENPARIGRQGPISLDELPTSRARTDFLAVADVLRRRRWEWDAKAEHDPLYLCDEPVGTA